VVTITICFWLCSSGYHYNLFLVLFEWLPSQFVFDYVQVVTITICFWLCLSGYHYNLFLVMFEWLPLQFDFDYVQVVTVTIKPLCQSMKLFIRNVNAGRNLSSSKISKE